MIHETAIIDPDATIGTDVSIGPFSIIHSGVQIGNNSVVGSHCELGVETPLAESNTLSIGENSTIRSHSVFYIGSEFGANLRTGHRVTVREGTIAGDHFQIGTLSDIQGHCKIGDHVRFHSNVHIGQTSEIGNFVFIFPYAVLTNDPHPPSDTLSGPSVGDYSIIATMSVLLPGVTIGQDALVGAMTTVRDDVPDGMICVGQPGKIVGPTSKIRLKDSGEPAYPWRRHFHRGYPKEIVDGWIAELS